LSGLRMRCALLVGFVLAGAGCAPSGPPDVLLVVVDTLRADHLGTYGFDAKVSPNVDALAARGVVFERAIAASARTTPSHASLMTSRFVAHHAVGERNGTTRLDGEETLALRLQAAGYATAAFVGNINLRRRVGLAAGFDLYDDELPDAEPNRPQFFERTAEKTTERALAWLAEQGEGPIFLWVHYQDPHGPYTPPPPFDAGFSEPAKAGEAPLPVLENDIGKQGIPAYQRFDDEHRPGEYRRRYAGEIAFFDASLGQLLAAFEARGRPAVIAFTADHGESLGEGGYWFAHGHASTPDLGRIPLVLVAPGLAPGRRGELVHHVDVMPTLLELAGVAVPDGIDGIALGPPLRAGEPLPERTVFCDVGDDIAAYLGDRFFRFWVPQATGKPEPARHGTFRWRPGEAWESVIPGDPILASQLAQYHRNRKPTKFHGETFTSEELERLRALGYAVPQEEAR